MATDRPFDKVGVVGAGQMGTGIAQVFAHAGSEVRLHDAAAPALDRGIQGIKAFLDRSVEKGKVTREAADLLYGSGRLSPQDLANAIAEHLRSSPGAADADALSFGLWRWFGLDAEALVAAVRHRMEEEEGGELC